MFKHRAVEHRLVCCDVADLGRSNFFFFKTDFQLVDENTDNLNKKQQISKYQQKVLVFVLETSGKLQVECKSEQRKQ